MSGRTSGFGLRRTKQILASMIVVGVLGSVTIHRTYAALSGETQNAATSISSGTLTFNMTTASYAGSGGTGTVCYTWKTNGAGQVNDPADPQPGNSSYFDSNLTLGCDAPFTDTVPGSPTTPQVFMPGSTQVAEITISDDGSLTAGDLALYMPTSCVGTNATPNAPAGVVTGAGDLCANNGTTTGPTFWVQEWTSNTFATALKCWYPSGATTCVQTSKTLYNFHHSYGVNSPDLGGQLDLGEGPAAQGSRYFTIGMALPATTSATLQGLEAQFSLGWIMTN